MKAWLLDQIGGGIDSLRIGEIESPVAVANEVVLDVIYAGLNPADRYESEGQYPAKPALPHILGRDAVGYVRSLDPGVDGISVGQKYAILRGEAGVNRAGTFAEQVVVPADVLVNVPEGWTDEQAAAAPLVYLTAFQAISQWRDLPAGAVALVTGASGGVGVASIQLLKAMGHTVVALSRGASKVETLREIGADVVLDPTSPTWRKSIADHTGGRKVDLAIDNIGGPLFSQVIESLAKDGRVSCVGRLAGPVPEFNTASLFFRRAQIRGCAVGDYSAAEAQGAWQRIVELLDSAGKQPIVDHVFAFDELKEAFARLKKGPIGKVLIRVRA